MVNLFFLLCSLTSHSVGLNSFNMERDTLCIPMALLSHVAAPYNPVQSFFIKVEMAKLVLSFIAFDSVTRSDISSFLVVEVSFCLFFCGFCLFFSTHHSVHQS